MTDQIMQLAGVIQREFDALKASAQNTANINTVGYRAVSSYNTFNVVEGADTSLLNSRQTQEYIDKGNGSLIATNQPLDLALSGDGWFVVQANKGYLLTRDGHFNVNPNGELVNRQGNPVVDENKQSIQLDTAQIATLKVDQAGTLITGETDRIGRLLIVNPDVTTIQPQGNSTYVTSDPLLTKATRYQVSQGKLEQSNSMMSQDMVKIMELSRHIESVQRAINTYDSLLNSGINELGK